MFKKIISILGSSKTTLALLFVFGFSCAYGTFFENDFGTDEVRAVVYNSWWFELVMALLMVNFILNLKKYNLLKREKITLFLFHFGFIIILVGAFISRYTGYEGLVNIREGQSVSHILSDKNYLTLEEDEGILFKKQVVPSAIRPTRFNETIPLNEKQVELQSIGFIPNAQEIIVDGEKRILELVLAENGARKTYFLHEDQRLNVNGNSIAFKKDLSNTVAIFYENDSLRIWSDSAIVFMNMLSQSTGSFEAGKTISLEYSTLYQVGSLAFVAVVMHENAGVNWQSSQDSELKKVLPGKLVINLKCDGKEQVHSLDYRKGSSSFRTLEIDNTKLKLALGPEKIQLGFQLHLTDFELKRYPGSTSPSEYSSHLEVINGNERFPYTIFMNNVLDHKGFRFFQASYDTDELGTILSVNHDKAGTLFTYLGYFILGLGMVLSLFSKSTRFQFIIRSLSKIKAKKASLTAVLIALTLVGVSQNRAALSKKASIYSTELTDEFGSLLVQDMDGRIKPVNTLASELLRKLTGKTKFEFLVENETFEIDPNQFMLAVHAKPMFWAQMPLIAIDDEKGDIIFDALGKDKVRFLEFREFFDSDGHYLLEKQVETVHRTKTSDRSVFDKEVVKVDERFNILYKALSDSYLKLFPRPNDQEKHWFSDKGMLIGYPSEDSLFVKNILNMLFASGDSAITVGNWEQSIQYAKYIGKYQNTIAADIVPSSARIQTELFYNKANVFLHLFYSYWLFGALLLTLSVVSLFKRSKVLSVVKNVSAVIVFILFLFHTANIIIRWYAGGYPPWSNGYEMTILVSWATMFFGLILRRRSDFMLPLACLFTGTLLFVSFLDWLNPEITNLVPVLKSYWLKIHVAVIVGSYAPLALSALLGLTGLWLMIFDKGNNERVKLSIKEITLLNEASITIGLYMLAIGTFLGGVWANESWGRYWGWDPKETWALISVIVYAFVLHMRLVPGIKPIKFWFNAASITAFFSIIMTSYGVNYYLSGLHSYAQGDPVPIPSWVYYVSGSVLISIVIAFFRTKSQTK